MNLPIFGCFILIVIAFTVIVVKLNMSEDSDSAKTVVNIIAGMCLAAYILFLPFGIPWQCICQDS